jgi:solute carrier family 13 (sodium-dependent dicarboxylate transporter), member 2/3/5
MPKTSSPPPLLNRQQLIKVISLLAGPLIFLVISQLVSPGLLSAEGWRVMAVAAWMVLWWITEAVPIPVTALLPMILFPLLGIFKMDAATAPYANPIIFLFMGGFIIALAMERRNLHTRIALNLIRLTGTHANGIILGFMLATGFISMWISNTATAVMMLPIAMSVINLLQSHSSTDPASIISFRRFALCVMLGIAYAANIGGTATIIGTPPNVVLVGYMNSIYGYDLAFGRWLMIGIPISIGMLLLTYWILVKWLYPSGLGEISGTADIVKTQLASLGKLSKAEKMVGTIFVCTALAWIFRQPINALIGNGPLNDTIIAMAGGVLMFIVPLNLRNGEFLLDWKSMERLPWGILLLFGGGMCLAEAMEETGIIQLVGKIISDSGPFSLWLLILLLSATTLFLTELMSNVALTTIFVPVVMGIADGLQISPLLLAIPVTLASSFAFMMPISTPPNAIVFASGFIKTDEMVRAGLILNIVSILLLTLLSLTLVQWVYGPGLGVE